MNDNFTKTNFIHSNERYTDFNISPVFRKIPYLLIYVNYTGRRFDKSKKKSGEKILKR